MIISWALWIIGRIIIGRNDAYGFVMIIAGILENLVWMSVVTTFLESMVTCI